MIDKLIILGYVILIFLIITTPVYLLYTYAYDRAVFETLKKIECIKGDK